MILDIRLTQDKDGNLVLEKQVGIYDYTLQLLVTEWEKVGKIAQFDLHGRRISSNEELESEKKLTVMQYWSL